ncbi:IclR family transcriptional regulator [Tranquillimonas alkanivorans]|uniref:Transcriptional regulator, IclR family n=1 Tax=Tranquillimonas alkanivorans TaxID=441119 RepID=A0A1I5W9K0_9RHOB|nr:IclR family transcriptional regulator [Tranquillimonas alkanivorans]SFQ16414.1 transcriptional regulator, IclR family [Tranquillimonas alkanivorans]
MDGNAATAGVKTRTSQQAGVQSVEVAGKILQVLIQADGPMKLASIAAEVGMPSAKVHRYLVSLIRTGYVLKADHGSGYDLGPVSFQLGLKGFARFEPLKLAEEMLRELVELVGETAALAVWTEKGPTMIRVIEARHEYATSIAPTHHCPLTFSATGVLFVSFEDAARTDAVIERELEQNRIAGRPNAPRSRSELAEMISQTREHGLSCMNDGGGDGFGAVSAPVFDVTGKLSMALTVFGRSNRVDASPESTLARIVSRTAAKVSAAFGFME